MVGARRVLILAGGELLVSELQGFGFLLLEFLELLGNALLDLKLDNPAAGGIGLGE